MEGWGKLGGLRPRQPLVGVALAAGLGITLADYWAPWPAPVLLCGVALVCALVLVQPRTWSCWLLTALVFFTLHTLRHHGSEARRLAQHFAAGPKVVRATGIVRSIPEKPAFWSPTISARFRLKLEELHLGGSRRSTQALINVSWAGPPPALGDRVELIAMARNLEAPRNPGQFDYRNFLQRQGIFAELRARFPQDCRILQSTGHLGGFTQSAQNRIRRSLALDLGDSPEIVALIESMVLGLHGETPEEWEAMFQRTGTLHLFAVSGLNVAMLAMIGWFALKPLGVGRKLSVLVILPLLAFYAVVTGLSVSCVRATIMTSLLLAGFLFERPALVYNSLAAAALLILSIDTNQLFSLGFQFSFVLVLAIVALAEPIRRRCLPFGQPDAFLPRALWSWRDRFQAAGASSLAGALGVTVAAWLGSLPFTAGYFHLFSPVALVANLLAVPLAFLILALGMSAVLCAPVWSTGAIWCNNANWLCAHGLLAVVRFCALAPGGHIYVEWPRFGARPLGELAVLDLGEGAALHWRAPRQDWLFDCGHAARYDAVLLPYLRSRGVNRLDGLLLTHGDAQHLGAAAQVLVDFAPRSLVDSALKDRSPTRRALHQELAARGLGKALLRRGDCLQLGELGGTEGTSQSIRLEVLYPPAGLARSSADDKALVLRLTCGSTRLLLTSDSGFATEQWLLQNEPDLRADLLIKGQHAKDLSGSPEFLARVQPQAVICSAANFGAPPAILDRWSQQATARGIVVFRQDHCGAVQIEIQKNGFTARGFLNGQIFSSRAR